MKIFVGREKPLTAQGKNQCHALAFAVRHPGWHYFNPKCRATIRALEGLARRGSIKIDRDLCRFCAFETTGA